MTKLILLIILAALLVSCTQSSQDIQDIKTKCEVIWWQLVTNDFGRVFCSSYMESPVQKCISKYVSTIDEKYNNPDTVSNLADSNFSEAVKTCNEVFGKK